MLTRSIIFKGTRQGILAGINEEKNIDNILEDFKEKIKENENFFKGSKISLDLGWRELKEDEFLKFKEFFKKHNLAFQGIISSNAITRNLAESYGIKSIIGRLGLAEHQGRNLKQKNNKQEDNTLSEQTLLIKRTLRSGQKINFSGNVVVLGDINPGAEVIAGGDIVAMGTIRGMVHAGTQNYQASILALKLHSTQLRIGDKIAYSLNNSKNTTPQVAKIINEAIIILPFGN